MKDEFDVGFEKENDGFLAMAKDIKAHVPKRDESEMSLTELLRLRHEATKDFTPKTFKNVANEEKSDE